MLDLADQTGVAGEAGKPAASLPIRRATVEELVALRNRALTLYGEAHSAIAAASAALEAARDAACRASPGINRFNHQNYAPRDDKDPNFIGHIKVPERAAFMASARKLVDTDTWSHIVQITDLQRLMDKKAKDQFHQQLLADPPEVTTGNVIATLERFLLEADTIWKRGIAEAFSNLDRRFRSHDGWKIGGRVILSHAFNESGRWSYHRNHQDTLIDIERVFRIIESGLTPASYTGAVNAIDVDRRHTWEPRQSYVETDYFRIRIFKNGNAHLWFTRDDLVEKVNKLLGEYYGAPIPEDREPDKDTGLNDPKTTLAKRYGFFPTPDPAAELVVKEVPLVRHKEEPRLTVLEPSAGTGNLARRCMPKADKDWHSHDEYCWDNLVDCVEIQPHLAGALAAEGIYRKVYDCNFLMLSPETTGLYDRVVMNPPFDRERDIDHVMHALKFLKPDGCLVAVMSAGTEFRETRKSIAFRDLMKSMHARFGDLPAGSFSEVGTNCNTIVLKVWKDRSAQGWSFVNRSFE